MQLLRGESNQVGTFKLRKRLYIMRCFFPNHQNNSYLASLMFASGFLILSGQQIFHFMKTTQTLLKWQLCACFCKINNGLIMTEGETADLR